MHAKSAVTGLKLSIRTKLLGTAGVLLAFAAVIGGVSYMNLSTTGTQASEMNTKTVLPLKALGSAYGDLQWDRVLFNKYLLEPSATKRADILTEMQTTDKSVLDLLASVKPTLMTDAGKASYAAIESNFNAWVAARPPLLALVEQGKTADAYDRMGSETTPLITKSTDAMDALLTQKGALAETQYAAVDPGYPAGDRGSVSQVDFDFATAVAQEMLFSGQGTLHPG